MRIHRGAWGALMMLAVWGCDDGEDPENLPADMQAVDMQAADMQAADMQAADMQALPPDPPGGARGGLFFPADPGTPGPHPILIVLHGTGASPRLITNQFKFQDHAPARGITIVAPEGTEYGPMQRAWNARHCCLERDVDDVAYLTGLIDELVAHHDGDPERVWIFGHSNGGFMAHHLACAVADRLTGIIPAAGLGYPRDQCDPARPLSVIQIHGDADDQVAIDGGGSYPGAAALATYWAEQAGCAGSEQAPDEDFDRFVPGAETHRQRWTGCAPGVAVEQWTLAGGGHQYLPDPAMLTALLDFIAPE
ncbi:MAG: alpha/beta hydrolase fold domain-containing protein [Myxococcales bacterium]|nr:alpha/beta hydrolase fold domain-containing protein [Myxococcales bacterium]